MNHFHCETCGIVKFDFPEIRFISMDQDECVEDPGGDLAQMSFVEMYETLGVLAKGVEVNDG